MTLQLLKTLSWKAKTHRIEKNSGLEQMQLTYMSFSNWKFIIFLNLYPLFVSQEEFIQLENFLYVKIAIKFQNRGNKKMYKHLQEAFVDFQSFAS